MNSFLLIKRIVLPCFILLLLLVNFTAHAQPGSLDITFGTGGKVQTKPSTTRNYGETVAIQKDGKIIVGGYSWQNGYQFTLVRYKTDGTVDSTFGTNGVTFNTYFGYQSFGQSVQILDDGRILLGGYAYAYSKTSFALARFTPNGYPDYSFGFGGVVITPYPDDNYQRNDYGTSLAIQKDGKYLLGGYLTRAGSQYFNLVRYNTEGEVDTTFGVKGDVVTKFNTTYDTIDNATKVLIQADGKIILTGYASTNLIGYNFALARYNRLYIWCKRTNS